MGTTLAERNTRELGPGTAHSLWLTGLRKGIFIIDSLNQLEQKADLGFSTGKNEARDSACLALSLIY